MLSERMRESGSPRGGAAHGPRLDGRVCPQPRRARGARWCWTRRWTWISPTTPPRPTASTSTPTPRCHPGGSAPQPVLDTLLFQAEKEPFQGMLDVNINIQVMTHQLLRLMGIQDGSRHHACIRSQPVKSALSRASPRPAGKAQHAHKRGACLHASARALAPSLGRARADRPCCAPRQVDAGAYGTQAMNLQGFYLRGGVDSTAVEAQFNYTRRAAEFQAIGGAQFLSTFFDVPPPQNLLPSTYQVLSLTLSTCLTLTLPCRVHAGAAALRLLRRRCCGPAGLVGLHAGGQWMWARAQPKYLCTAEASRCRAGQPSLHS